MLFISLKKLRCFDIKCEHSAQTAVTGLSWVGIQEDAVTIKSHIFRCPAGLASKI